ncbi:MAG: hypothetical protein K6B72_13730 [Lachnospiraceae bacterium]|nr:hypothetical protein [Lachnospiraceae bacterium]
MVKMLARSALLLTVILLGLTSCSSSGSDTGSGKGSKGGKGALIDKSDKSAPKEIESRDITDLHAKFWLRGEWSSGRIDEYYDFAVEPDASGTLTASESETGVTVPADEELLLALQEIIEEQHLAAKNGKNEYQAIPPGPCDLEVHYASGEKLSFSYNNGDGPEWAKAIYLTFSEWFASKGEESLLVPKYEGRADSLELKYNAENPDDSWYYTVMLGENEYTLMRSLGGAWTKTKITDLTGFCDDVNRVLDGYDLRPYDRYSALYGYGWDASADRGGDDDVPYLKMIFWYEDDSQLQIKTHAPEAIENLLQFTDELRVCFDSRMSGEQ